MFDNNNSKERFVMNTSMWIPSYRFAKKLNSKMKSITAWAKEDTILFNNKMSYMKDTFIKYNDIELVVDIYYRLRNVTIIE